MGQEFGPAISGAKAATNDEALPSLALQSIEECRTNVLAFYSAKSQYCESKSLQVVMLVDRTSPLSNSYARQTQLLTDLVSRLNDSLDSEPGRVRLSIVSFWKEASVEVSLNSSLSYQKIAKKLALIGPVKSHSSFSAGVNTALQVQLYMLAVIRWRFIVGDSQA